MRFAQYTLFHLLWGALLLGIFLYWANIRHRKLLYQFAQSSLLESIAASFDKNKRTIHSILILLVVIFSIIALARPQWGFEWQEVKRKGIDILLVIDTSKSMLTRDVKPNRLERTKLAVKDLLKVIQGDRIGLIGFAGQAFLLCPLTTDYDGFLLSLDHLNTRSIPRGGTNIGSAIESAIKNIDEETKKHKAIIIITDGENMEGDPLAYAQKAKDRDIKAYCIGIGTTEGELIQVANSQGEVEFLKDQDGNFVKSRLNEGLLQRIALITGGAYVKSSGVNFGLDIIYEKELDDIEKRDIKSNMQKKYFERFQWPLAAAVCLLLVETCMGTRKRRQKEQ